MRRIVVVRSSGKGEQRSAFHAKWKKIKENEKKKKNKKKNEKRNKIRGNGINQHTEIFSKVRVFMGMFPKKKEIKEKKDLGDAQEYPAFFSEPMR